jgi:hypothetical protein
MSLLIRLGRGLQGFMSGGIGPKILQQTLTSSGTYTTTSGRDLSIILLGGGAPGNTPTANGGAVGNITFGVETFNAPFPYTVGGASGTTNFSPNLQATGGTGTSGGGAGGNPAGNGTSYPVAAPAPLAVTPSPVIINRGAGGGGNTAFLGQYPAPQPGLGLGGTGGGSGPHKGGDGGRAGQEIADPETGTNFFGGNPGENGGFGAGGGGGGRRHPGTNNPGLQPAGSGGPGIIYVYYGS